LTARQKAFSAAIRIVREIGSPSIVSSIHLPPPLTMMDHGFQGARDQHVALELGQLPDRGFFGDPEYIKNQEKEDMPLNPWS
jgi:hypothetical protein